MLSTDTQRGNDYFSLAASYKVSFSKKTCPRCNYGWSLDFVLLHVRERPGPGAFSLAGSSMKTPPGDKVSVYLWYNTTQANKGGHRPPKCVSWVELAAAPGWQLYSTSSAMLTGTLQSTFHHLKYTPSCYLWLLVKKLLSIAILPQNSGCPEIPLVALSIFEGFTIFNWYRGISHVQTE